MQRSYREQLQKMPENRCRAGHSTCCFATGPAVFADGTGPAKQRAGPYEDIAIARDVSLHHEQTGRFAKHPQVWTCGAGCARSEGADYGR
jgi:hypothetical protein